jgi:hypothetical protein
MFAAKRIVVFIILSLSCADAFTPSSIPTTTKVSKTAVFDVHTVPRDDGSGISYSERSRPYRRDVFAYDDWVKHRSSDRFTGRLGKLTKSGIVRSLSKEIALIAGAATFICIFNALLGSGYDDFTGVHHAPLVSGLPTLSLPATFFTLSSPALSLLLGTCKCWKFCSSVISLVLRKLKCCH